MEIMGEHLVPTLNVCQYIGLGMITAIIGISLSLEHYAIGRRAWPRRYYYAVGLVTDAGLLLAWAGVERVTMNLGTAALMLLAGCLAGLPDWLLLQRREKRLAIAWREMIKRNEKLAGDLARAMLVVKARDRARIQDMVEGLGFALGCMRQDLDDMQIIAGHLEPLLAQFLAIVDRDGTEPKI